MDEKRTIMDELLTQARIYLDEKVGMVIKNVEEDEDFLDFCSRCGKPLKEIYERPEELTSGPNDFGLVVFKCEKCTLFHAFWIEPYVYDPTFLNPAKEDEHLGGRIVEPPQWKYRGKPQWGEGKQPRFSKETAKAYERTVSQQDLSKKLKITIQDKCAEMRSTGLSVEIINLAREKVLNYLRNNTVTSKQLVKLFAAAIYESSHGEHLCVGRHRRRGEKISERQLEKIFGVTRKTIRKWRKRLLHSIGNPHP